MSINLLNCKPSKVTVGYEVDSNGNVYPLYTLKYNNGCPLSKSYKCNVYELTIDQTDKSFTLDFGNGCSVESYVVTSVTFYLSSLEVTYIDSNSESQKANFSYTDITNTLGQALGSVFVFLGAVKKRTHKLFSKLK